MLDMVEIPGVDKIKKNLNLKITNKSKYNNLKREEEQNKWLWKDFLELKKTNLESEGELMRLLSEGEGNSSEMTPSSRSSLNTLRSGKRPVNRLDELKERNVRNILIIGKSFKGKSTLGNILLGEKFFTERSGGERLEIVEKKETDGMGSVRYKIIDTVGNEGMNVADLRRMIKEGKARGEELEKLVKFGDMIKEGVNQILLVVGSDFTQNDKNWMESYALLSAIIFGNDIGEVKKYVTIVVNKYNGTTEVEKDNIRVNIRNSAKIKPFSILINDKEESIIFVNDKINDENGRTMARNELIEYLNKCQNVCQPKNLIKLSNKISKFRKEGEWEIKGIREYIEENKEEIMEQINKIQSEELKQLVQENKMNESFIIGSEKVFGIAANIASIGSFIATIAACIIM